MKLTKENIKKGLSIISFAIIAGVIFYLGTVNFMGKSDKEIMDETVREMLLNDFIQK